MKRNSLLSLLIAVLAILALTGTTATAAKRRGPDLTIKSVRVQSTITAGELVELRDATRNGGRRSAKRTTTSFVLSADARRDAKDAVLATRKLKTLKARKVASGTAQGRVPASAKAGRAFVIACADGGSAVKERSERNNCKAVPVTVSVKGVAPHGTPPPSSGGDNPGGGGQIPAELPPPLVEPAKDPAEVAPPVSGTTNTTMAAGTRFLYSGDDPIQKGVADGTIKPTRVAVLRGKVTDTTGKPLPAVKVTVLGHAELGYTATRADGGFDIAVNGGEEITLEFARPGLIGIQATVDAPWADFVDVRDVAMTPYDPDVTTIDADSAAPIQVASGGPVTDGDGTRSATLMFEKGTDAEMTLRNGETKPLEDIHIRATEYTVGANGENAMPGNLPDTSAYTYAVEFSIDEAEQAGATEVRFDKPVATYVDDFLGFPAGTKVPAAYYDEQNARWVPSDDGLVIKVLSVANGIAAVDVDGDDQADGVDQLTPLRLDEAELRQIAARYPAGKVLWRVEVEHFSPWDYNWPYACTEFCEPPQQEEPPVQESPECEATGSIIGCLNQSLGESVAINGSDVELAYSTVRMPGYKEAYSVDIPLTGSSLPPGVKGIEVIVNIAGREFARSYDAALNLRHTFTWDGRDAYGRTLDGAQNATIRIGYTYGAVYMASREAQQRSFGQFGIAVLTRSMAREEITAWQTYTRPLGASGTGSDALGGWTIAQHHTYDPIGRTLYLGDGSKRTTASVRSQVGPWFGARPNDDLGLVRGIAAAADGSVFVAEADRNRVRRIAPDGTATVVAGGGSPADGLGDGLPATMARLSSPSDVDFGPDGALYVSDTGNGRVRRIGTDGTITTVAGGGDELGDDGRAREASLDGPRGIAVASDGTLYIADAGHDRVRRVTPDGHITTAAGGGDQGLGDGGSALAAELDLPTDVAIDAAGTLYIADTVHHRVRAVTAMGVISTLAGDGVAGGQGDGGPATEARLSAPHGVEVDRSGNVYIADRTRHVIRRVSATGHITRYAGTGVSGSGADGGAPARTALSFPQDVAELPDGSMAIADTANHLIRRVGRGLPGYTDADLAIPSGNGSEVYLFDSAGKHLRTVNALTNAPIHEFAYDAAGRLQSITDRDGLTTRIERDGTGKPTAVVAPNGRVTRLFLNGAGLLESIEDPAQNTTRLTYHDGGLLGSFTRPEGGRSTFEYDTRGRLKKDVGPDGRSSTLSVTPQPGGNVVTVETTLGRKTVYRTETGPDGTRRRTVTEPGGAKTTSYTTEDGESVVVAPDGTKRKMLMGPDPRWGMAAPIAERETIETPSGKRRVVRKARTVTLSDPRDLLSVEKVTDVIIEGDRTYTATITAPPVGGPDEWTAKAKTPEGRETTRVFNSQGHVLRDQVKGRAAARYEYDGRGRFKTLKRGSGEAERTASFEFNDHDEVANATNQFGDVASFTYDDAGRPESRTAFDGTSVTGYEHNDDGLTTSVTPPGRSAFTRDIGADGLLHGSLVPAVGQQPNATTFEYDRDARIKKLDLPGPRSIGHAYDPLSGHETSVTLERGSIGTDVEHATGRVRSITAPGGVKLDFSYDGGLALGQTWSGPVAGSVGREVDDELRTTVRTVNGVDPVTFSYDDDGLLDHAGDETLGYDPDNGALTSLTLGGLTETWTYDEFGAARSMTAKRGAETVYALSFIRDNAGRITSRTETIGGETHVLEYTYDERSRLQTVKRDGTQIADPEYDATGNRTDGATEHDAQDRITQRGPATYAYDPEGHRISRTAPNGATAYAYDELGNLLGVTLPGKHVEYVIDGKQRRIGKKVDGQLVQGLLWEGQLRPSAQLDGAGQVVSRFVYGARGNVPDYMVRAGEKYRLVADERGSVRLVVNVATGQVAQRLDYDEWGRVTADTNPGFQPFGYAGGLYDPDTGLVRFGVRDYDAETGRWMSKDPSGFGAGDTNLYAYAANDPVNNADPNGLWTIPTQTPFDIMDYFKDRTKELWPDTVDKDGNVTTNLDRWNGPGDAWRHCAGSCEVARQYGESIAEFLGDAHEIEGDIFNNQERGEKEMDLFNNACGREIGKRAESLTDCEQGCNRALRNGELKTYEQGTTPTFSEEISKMMQDFAGFSGTGFNGFPRMGGMGF